MSETPRAAAGMARLPQSLSRALEIGGVLLILIVASIPRARDFNADFDREFEGWQGAFFALSAINYERQGVDRYLGYPIQDIDLPESKGVDEPQPSDAFRVTLYANHPPAVPLLAWLSAKWMGPSGWETAWEEDRAPQGLEPVLRLPFLLAHMGGLLLLYLAVRCAAGTRRAMLTLALLAAMPVSILYGTLINYENPALLFILGATLFHVRYLRAGRTQDLIGFGGCALLGSAVTFFHLFFLPGLLLQAFLLDRKRALKLALAAGVGALGPLLLHGWMSSNAFAELGQSPDLLLARVQQMLAPLLDGSIPITRWASFQIERGLRYFSEAIAVTAALGLILALWPRGGDRAQRADRPIELCTPLLAGGVLLLLVMYKHTSDGWGGGGGQVPFLMYLTPGVAAAAALVLDRLALPLSRLKGGIAPLVIATSMICLPGVERANDLRRPLREPGPRDDPALQTGPSTPLPRAMGEEIAHVIPEGEVAIYPAALGLTPAHMYYAWRTLVPVDPTEMSSMNSALAKLAARERDSWLLLPADSSGELETMSEALFALVQDAVPGAERDAPDRTGRHWHAWRLPRR